MNKRQTRSRIYPLVVIAIAVVLLAAMGVTGQFHWSYTLTFLAVACILSEWQVIKLPRGDSLTLSIIFILLTLVFQEASSLEKAIGAVEVIAIGALIGYGLIHRPPPMRLAFYVAHHILAASAAGGAFVLISENLDPWLIDSFHLPAVTAYTVVFSLLSMLMISPLNARILKGDKLPKAELMYTLFLAPIALIVYYFYISRGLNVGSLFILALPLVGVLVTFKLYIDIDTSYGEVNQLYRISKEFVAAMSQEETVQKISESIAQAIAQLVLQIDSCLVYAYNDEANEYLLINTEDRKQEPLIILPDRGLLGRASKGTGEIFNDVTLQDGLSPDERKWPTKTAILVHSLMSEQQQVGLLVLVRQGKGFTAEEFRLVSIVANQAGVTLHNAQMYERSRQLADTDRQLGLLNQTAFKEQSQLILGRAQIASQSVAVLTGDIDDFRKVNNAFGHLTGDRVLVGVAQLMQETIGSSGIVGRWGGEEFAITLPNTNEQDAIELANKVRLAVRDCVFESDDGRDVRITISMGVAFFPRDAGDIEHLVKRADRAMYLAKRTGKNKVCPYEDRKEMLTAEEPEPALAEIVLQE